MSELSEERLHTLQVNYARLAVECDRLREALIAHRIDLHQSSDRPCPTCRQSAAALGGNAPGGCIGERRQGRPAVKQEGSK